MAYQNVCNTFEQRFALGLGIFKVTCRVVNAEVLRKRAATHCTHHK